MRVVFRDWLIIKESRLNSERSGSEIEIWGVPPMRVVFRQRLITKECRLNGEIRSSEKRGGRL